MEKAVEEGTERTSKNTYMMIILISEYSSVLMLSFTFHWKGVKPNECFINSIIIAILQIGQNNGNLHRPEECPSFHTLLAGCNP